MSTVLGISRARLERFAADPRMPAHLGPVMEATISGGIILAQIAYADRHVAIPKRLRDRGMLVLVGDDGDVSRGPDAFCRRLLRRLVAPATHVCIHAAAAQVEHYGMFARLAASGRQVVVVETQPRHQAAWLKFLGRYAAGRQPLIITPDVSAMSPEVGTA